MQVQMMILCLLCLFLALCAADFKPEHVYLSLTGDPTSVQVTFTTSTAPVSAQVSYWVTGNPVTVLNVTSPDVHTFVRPVTSRKNFITTVTLTKLARFTYYNYQILGDTKNKSAISPVFKFRTLPEDGKAVRVCIYGDLGAEGAIMIETGPYGLPKASQAGNFDVIFHNGDFGYNLGTSDGAIGDKFMLNVQEVAAYTPYIVTPGNHEFYSDSHPYYDNFFVGQTLLGKHSASVSPTDWFSVDIGTVHFVGISTEVYCENTANIQAQYEWLEKDLAAAHSRADKPWIVVIGHRPLYFGLNHPFAALLMKYGLQCTTANKTDCNPLKPCKSGTNCAYSIEQLLTKYKIDMFNAGHEHSYMRMYPISSTLTYEVQDSTPYVNAQHPVYIINGAAGTASGAFEASVETTATPPAVLTSDVNSYSILTAYNNTHVHYQQIAADKGDVIDEFWMIKDSKKAPWAKVAKFTLPENNDIICDT